MSEKIDSGGRVVRNTPWGSTTARDRTNLRKYWDGWEQVYGKKTQPDAAGPEEDPSGSPGQAEASRTLAADPGVPEVHGDQSGMGLHMRLPKRRLPKVVRGVPLSVREHESEMRDVQASEVESLGRLDVRKEGV